MSYFDIGMPLIFLASAMGKKEDVEDELDAMRAAWRAGREQSRIEHEQARQERYDEMQKFDKELQIRRTDNNGNGNGNGVTLRWALGVTGLLCVAAIVGLINMYRTQGIQDREVELLQKLLAEERTERRNSDSEAQRRMDVFRDQLLSHDERVRRLEEDYRNHMIQDQRRYDDLNRDKRYKQPYDR